ncbi:hypothetical protein WDU94_008941 [Cyamophila willieti]
MRIRGTRKKIRGVGCEDGAESDKFTPVQAKYNYCANNPSEISITAGQHLRMKPLNVHDNQLPLWVLVADSDFNKGFVPLSYLTPIDK